MTIARVGDGALGFPEPANCSTGTSGDTVDITCWWRDGDYAQISALFRQLLAHAASCLGTRLNDASGPRPYGDTQALLESETVIRLGRGATTLSVSLIEQPADTRFGIDAYHYIVLTAGHELEVPADDE